MVVKGDFMPIAATLQTTIPVDATQSEFIATGILTLSGSYPTNGDTLDLSQLGIGANSVPIKVEIFETTPAPGPASGFNFVFLPGTTQANGLMEMFNGTTQQTTATYASIVGGITGFALRFRAWFTPAFV